MRRRDSLRTTTGAATLPAARLAAPGISQAADSKVLRFVPQANLAYLDPILTTQYVVQASRNNISGTVEAPFPVFRAVSKT